MSTRYVEIAYLSEFGRAHYNKLYSPDTYSRTFRRMRENPKPYGFIVNKVPSQSKENIYSIEIIRR